MDYFKSANLGSDSNVINYFDQSVTLGSNHFDEDNFASVRDNECQVHHLIFQFLMKILPLIQNLIQLKYMCLSKIPLHLTVPCVLPAAMYLPVTEILRALQFLHLMSYHKAVMLSMMRLKTIKT